MDPTGLLTNLTINMQMKKKLGKSRPIKKSELKALLIYITERNQVLGVSQTSFTDLYNIKIQHQIQRDLISIFLTFLPWEM